MKELLSNSMQVAARKWVPLYVRIECEWRLFFGQPQPRSGLGARSSLRSSVRVDSIAQAENRP